jgi:uncharacterized protein (DUF2252 family)
VTPAGPAGPAGPAAGRDAGRALRKQVPRASQADWAPPRDRRDPVKILVGQEKDRVKELIPVRHQRMAESAFTFLRGAAAVMASDLATTPTTGITVQACGDAHLMNFGVYASPERDLLFDVNDFDETLPAPWEWDVKRLAASLVVAAQGNGFAIDDCRRIAEQAAASYRKQLRAFAGMTDQAVFYSRLNARTVLRTFNSAQQRRKTRKSFKADTQRTSLQAYDKLCETVDGKVTIVDDPPLITHSHVAGIADSLRAYKATLHEDVELLLDRYTMLDYARKVVGVGSVGTRCYIGAFQGSSSRDVLMLQVKEAQRSVLEPYARKSVYRNQGRRVVAGQRKMQAASDVFLGFCAGPDGRDYYWRQLRDMKGSADIAAMTVAELGSYGAACAWTLALAHANTGDRFQIAGYLGSGKAFDGAIGQFALDYAEQNASDYAEFKQAIAKGVLKELHSVTIWE